MIRNLVSNAPDAKAECNGDGCISLDVVLTGGFVDLSLRDNGMGLGLSISDNVAKDMGGDQVLAPAPDQGVAARLRLPACPRGFSRGRAMLAEPDPEWDGVILSDMRMPELSGLDLLAEARATAPGVPFVLITAHGDVRSAVQEIQRRAFDFIEKPAPPEYLLAVIRRAPETRRLLLENRSLKGRIARDPVGARRRAVSGAGQCADTTFAAPAVGPDGGARRARGSASLPRRMAAASPM